MSSKGYIKLARRAFDHPLWTKGGSKSDFEAWLDILQLATWAPRRERWTGGRSPRKIKIERGTFHATQAELGARWGWVRQKVQRLLKYLVETESITYTSDRTGVLITILNYARYQGGVEVEETTPAPKGEEEQFWADLAKLREAAYERAGKRAGKVKQTKARVELVRRRLAEYDYDTLLHVLRGAWFSDWHLGRGKFEGQSMKLVPENLLSITSKMNQVEHLSDLGYNPPRAKQAKPEDTFRSLVDITEEME
jgi:hypothetical protein